jgi:signal transduction histidine kinase
MSANPIGFALPKRRFRLIGAITVFIMASPLLIPKLFSTSFLPHSFCFLGERSLIALHMVSDVLIWLSYVAIAFSLAFMVQKAKGVPFHWMFLAFGLFIIACGFTHFMEVITLWRPLYWLSGYVKVVTAIASVSTALLLPGVIPKVTSMTAAAAASEKNRVEIEATNRELEAFSYSVSHDLRAPLRAIDGFSHAVLEDYKDKLDSQGIQDLQRVRAAAARMGALIDDMLTLSRTSRAEIKRESVDLSALAEEAIASLREEQPERKVTPAIEKGLIVQGDPGLLRAVVVNLLGNAWKFTGRRPEARIQFGMQAINGERVFHVRDNGDGFDMKYADRLFAPFQRLHTSDEFAGTGVGLALCKELSADMAEECGRRQSRMQAALFISLFPNLG